MHKKIIYKTINLINGKIYIGKSINNIKSYLGSGKLIKAAIKKYGKDNFKKIIIDHAESENELNEKEIFWIKFFNSTDKNIGYNIHKGGNGNSFVNRKNEKEIRLLLSEYGKLKTGNKNPFYGKTHSEETKKIIGSKNKIHSLNLVNLLSKDERKQKFGNPKEKNPMWGKKHTEEAKLLMSKNKVGLYVGELNGNFKKHTEEELNLIKFLYVEQKLTLNEIIKKTKISFKRLKRLFNILNINTSEVDFSGENNGNFKPLTENELKIIKDLYFIKHFSITKIYLITKITPDRIKRGIKEIENI